MQQIVDALELGISSDEIEDAEAVAAETGIKVNVKALPIGLRESLVGVPVSMHMPVLCGVMPICAAYADQVEVEYCDGNTHHLGSGNVSLTKRMPLPVNVRRNGRSGRKVEKPMRRLLMIHTC